ncbi:hypothetical protein K8I31_06170, partial [bacterium]|nr:hypothetical protein [bacterium]
NGHFIPIAAPKGKGPIWYHEFEVPADWLKAGANQSVGFAETEHHGIEVLLPGPALTVRYKK